jgi:fructose-1,6-bisphosphatase/sedoheptulose 1,7-bisphosphatase-like protein
MNCPNCHRLLYSRQHQNCGFCGAELPPGVVFSAAEIAAVQAEQQAIAVRRAQVRAKEEEAEREADEKLKRENPEYISRADIENFL